VASVSANWRDAPCNPFLGEGLYTTNGRPLSAGLCAAPRYCHDRLGEGAPRPLLPAAVWLRCPGPAGL